jgi:hypothetical protein
MRGGTGRLPGRDNEWDPGLYTFLLYLSPDVFIEAGRFFVPGRYYVFPYKHFVPPGRDDIMLTLQYLGVPLSRRDKECPVPSLI